MRKGAIGAASQAKSQSDHEESVKGSGDTAGIRVRIGATL
jgi:hypothetical protein